MGSEREIPQFWVFWPFSLRPTNSGYFSHVLSPLLPSKIIANIIGDEYGPILIIKVFGFGLFRPFLAIFGRFWHFWGFSGDFGVLEVPVSYKITRGIILVVGRVTDESCMAPDLVPNTK